MNKSILLTLIVAASALPSARAQLVVEDVASIAQNSVNQIVDLAKYIQMVDNQVQQIDTMTQELQQVTSYTKAFGDPSQITNVIGANQLVGSLGQPGVGRSLSSLQQSASGSQSLGNNGNGLYQSITNTAISGISIPRETKDYRPFGAVENASANYTNVYNDVMQRRQALKAKIAATINELQAATTDAETQKLQGVLTGQAAQLQAIDHEIDNATSQSVVQDIANRNNQQKQQQAQNEEVAADRQDALAKFGAMMVPDVNNDLRFGGSSRQ
jgi:hypothetical protein